MGTGYKISLALLILMAASLITMFAVEPQVNSKVLTYCCMIGATVGFIGSYIVVDIYEWLEKRKEKKDI